LLRIHAPLPCLGAWQRLGNGIWDIDYHIHLFTLEHGKACGIIRHLDPLHTAMLGFLPIGRLAPKVLPTLPDNAVSSFEFLNLVRSSPERVLDVAVVPYLLEVGARTEPDEVVIGPSYSGEKRWVRRLGLDEHMGGIDDLDFLDGLFHVGQSGGPLEGRSILPHEGFNVGLDVFGSGWSPILPFGLRVERQENTLGGLLPVSRPQGNYLHVLISMYQTQVQIALQQT